MAKKHKHPEHENLERWLVSYADFMTLLFATFTALYALSLSDVNKLKSVAEAISQGFEEQSILHGIKSILQGQSPPAENPDPIAPDKGAGPGIIGQFESMTYQPGEIKSEVKHIKSFVNDVKSEIEALNQDIRSLNMSAGNQAAGSTGTAEDKSTPIRPIEVAIQERGVKISFDSRLLFPAGSSSVRPEAHKFLDGVAERIKKYQGSRMFHVEGHTDDQAISTAVFPSNWELSGARASSVVRYFIGKHQFNPGSLVSVGYGATQPVASNKTPDGRAKNRRVDIVLYSEKMSALINPRLQSLKEQAVEIKTSDPADRTVIPVLTPEPDKHFGTTSTTHTTDGPVRVIIKEKDGTERILVPKTTKSTTDAAVKKVESHGTHAPAAKPAAQPAAETKQVIDTRFVKPGAPVPGTKTEAKDSHTAGH